MSLPVPPEIVPAGTTLFHGTLEQFWGGPRPGSWDKVMWTAETPAVAQSYIPISGGSILVSVDNLVRPVWDDALRKLQRRIGIVYDYDAVEWNQRYEPVSWPSAKGVRQGGMPSARDVLRRLLRTGWLKREDVNRHDPARTSMWLANSYLADGTRILFKPGEKARGRLYFGKPRRDLEILDAREGASGYQANDLGLFKLAKKAGYDGIRILDQLQSKVWGNVYHESVGLFPRGLRAMRWRAVPAVNYDAPGERDDPLYATWESTPEWDAVKASGRAARMVTTVTKEGRTERHRLQDLALRTYSLIHEDMEDVPMAVIISRLRGEGVDVYGVEDLEGKPPGQERRGPGELWHARYVKQPRKIKKHHTLHPRVPRQPLPGESKRARVSFALTPEDAVIALGGMSVIGTVRPRGIRLYTNTAPVDVLVPTAMHVPDAEESGERWALSPVLVRLVTTVPRDVWPAMFRASQEAWRRGYSEGPREGGDVRSWEAQREVVRDALAPWLASGRAARHTKDEPTVDYDEPGVDQRNPHEDAEDDQRNQFSEYDVRFAVAGDPHGGRYGRGKWALAHDGLFIKRFRTVSSCWKFAREIIQAGGIKPWRKLQSPTWRRKP